MILECPNCETRYELPAALPPEGRKVRCASCKHIWIATTPEPPQPQINLEDFQDEEVVFQDEEGARAEVPEPAAGESAGDALAQKPDDRDDGGISESEMEDAFAAAFGEAAVGRSAEEAEEAEEEDTPEPEPETPPIVIGKAKRRKLSLPANLAAGWAALTLFVAGVLAFGYVQRVNVVRLLPGAAAAYERIGLPVNVRGLEFEDVKYSWETSAGRPVLEVYGDIVNVTSEPLRVPTVVFGLRTKEKVEVYQWAADVRSELLPGGQKTALSAQIPTPPKSIRDVQVRFAKVR